MFPNLANLPLRPPAIPGRIATTLDILSDGRFELGIGTGGQGNVGFHRRRGRPRRDAGESIQALKEAVRIIRTL